jgi:hypothetical protein
MIIKSAKTGKETEIQGTVEHAIKEFVRIRKTEINAKYQTKQINTISATKKIGGAYRLIDRKPWGDETMICEFDIKMTFYTPTIKQEPGYQDATYQDWKSGKFHS